MHFFPSPEYPGLQVQLYDPWVLLQTAFTSQVWVLFLHSSLSNDAGNKDNICRQWILTKITNYMCCALILALGLFYGIANYENVYETKENKVKPRTSCTTKYSTLNRKPAQKDATSGKHNKGCNSYQSTFFRFHRIQLCKCKCMSPRYSDKQRLDHTCDNCWCIRQCLQ